MKSTCRKRPRIMLHTRRVVALFGQARLMREADGRFQLEGGNRHDRLAAIEWSFPVSTRGGVGAKRPG